jgi:hypothetical protein
MAHPYNLNRPLLLIIRTYYKVTAGRHNTIVLSKRSLTSPSIARYLLSCSIILFHPYPMELPRLYAGTNGDFPPHHIQGESEVLSLEPNFEKTHIKMYNSSLNFTNKSFNTRAFMLFASQSNWQYRLPQQSRQPRRWALADVISAISGPCHCGE